jgi:acetyl-CoA carboxylase alpha subunit
VNQRRRIASVGAAIAEALDDLTPMSEADLRKQRRDRFLAIGRFEADNAPGV